MKTIREEIITVKDSDGKTVDLGSMVIMLVEGHVRVGVYAGIGGRGAWVFKGIRQFSDVTYNIMPRSIKAMYLVGGEYAVHNE